MIMVIFGSDDFTCGAAFPPFLRPLSHFLIRAEFKQLEFEKRDDEGFHLGPVWLISIWVLPHGFTYYIPGMYTQPHSPCEKLRRVAASFFSVLQISTRSKKKEEKKECTAKGTEHLLDIRNVDCNIEFFVTF